MKNLLTLLFLFLSVSAFSQTSTLDGSASFDPDGTISSYAWKQISGPGVSTITNENSVKPVVSNLVAGVYQFELTVTDNDGAIGKDTMQLTVNPANVIPRANAGEDQIIRLPGSTTMIPSDAEKLAYIKSTIPKKLTKHNIRNKSDSLAEKYIKELTEKQQTYYNEALAALNTLLDAKQGL